MCVLCVYASIYAISKIFFSKGLFLSQAQPFTGGEEENSRTSPPGFFEALGAETWKWFADALFMAHILLIKLILFFYVFLEVYSN